MWAEVEAHLPAFAARRQVTVKALRASVQAVRGIVETVHEGQMSWLAHSPLVAEATAVDPKDADYVACLIHCGATWIWSHDKDLRAAFPQFVTHNPPFRPTGPT
jgi:predicted nucleic acid-binding protein